MMKLRNTRNVALDLFYKNTALAYFVLHKFFPQLVNSEDWQQEAMCGLWVACLTFDLSSNHKFSTYAIVVCKRHIMHLLRKKSVEVVDLYPTEDNEESLELLEGLYNVDYDSIVELKDIKKYMETLTPKQQEFLLMIVNGYTYTDIATRNNISRQAVQQMVSRARNNLERMLYEKK